ncbi:4'-phosphopantetheinyl transferase family protein [Amycolatopsis sp. NPDC059021]|uniref:4'-phosphopantetheinyl transferase family protein n=1 Tax=Amycolatopsis sp. NPDC059021 TaxID=3346704 RepID=UPI00366DB156
MSVRTEATALTVSVVGRQDGDRDVWAWSVGRQDDRWPAAARVLSEAELGLGERLRSRTARAEFRKGRIALRTVLGKVLGVSPAEVPLVPTAVGKVRVAGGTGLEVSLSHAGDMFVVAVGDRVRVGVDVESADRGDLAEHVARRCFSEAEQAELRGLAGDRRDRRFAEIWTRREAVVKAMGSGVPAMRSAADVIRAGERWRTTTLRLPDPYVGTLVSAPGQDR